MSSSPESLVKEVVQLEIKKEEIGRFVGGGGS